MDKHDRIQKLHRILSARRYPVPIKVLAEELECSEKTARRCIDDLQSNTHAPIEYCPNSKGWHYTGNAIHELPGTWFTSKELQAFMAMLQLMEQLPSSPISDELKQLEQKFCKLIDSRNLSSDSIQNKIKFLASNSRQIATPLFQSVAKYTFNETSFKIEYEDSSQNISTRSISPLQLVYYRENWYLDAWCHFRHGLRSFMVARIKTVRPTTETYIKVKKDVMQKHYAGAYGIFAGEAVNIAIIKFTPPLALEASSKTWHPQQQSRWQDDQYILELPYGDDRELIRDILHYGANVQILGPPELKQKLIATIDKMRSQYNKNTG